jgi:hypothetical protein
MNDITEIQPFVRDFKAARDILKERVERCKAEQAATVRRLHPGIKAAADKTRDAQARLDAAIDQNRHLFKRPKTQTIEGIKVGLAKGKGKTEVSENTIDLIKKFLPKMTKSLIKTKETIIKAGLSKLTATQLKKIGCKVTESGDQVVISVPKDNLDKLVEAMLQDVEA